MSALVTDAAAVTLSNIEDLPRGPALGFFVGVAGAVRVRTTAGSDVVVISGGSQYHPINIRRVFSDGTTAKNILALY